MKTREIIKLSANENCYGCSPNAIEAGINQFKNIQTYPDPNATLLKEHIARHFGVTKNNVVTGAGSVRIIESLIKTFVGINEEVLTFDNSFCMYGELSKSLGRKCAFAPLTDQTCNTDALYNYINSSTRLIFISNPNNPTGTIISHQELESFLSNISSNIIVVADEAYAEYVTDTRFPNSVELQKKYSNLVILRSFSKIYGLAALRAGYAIVNEDLAAKLEAVQIPFSINNIVAYTAIAALADTDFIKQCAAANARQRELLYDSLIDLGYRVVPSQANFLYVEFERVQEKNDMVSELFNKGIIVCDMEKSGQKNALRITIGPEKVNREIVDIFQQVSCLVS